jgi:hypothetical protein
MQAVLIMFRSDGQRRSFSVSREMTVIGRRQDCDLMIPLGEVSRKHCRIIRDGDDLRLEDLGSSNGTFYNGKRVQETLLHAGDTIQVGPVSFVVQIDGVPDEDEAQPHTADAPRAGRRHAAAAAADYDEDEVVLPIGEDDDEPALAATSDDSGLEPTPATELDDAEDGGLQPLAAGEEDDALQPLSGHEAEADDDALKPIGLEDSGAGESHLAPIGLEDSGAGEDDLKPLSLDDSGAAGEHGSLAHGGKADALEPLALGDDELEPLALDGGGDHGGAIGDDLEPLEGEEPAGHDLDAELGEKLELLDDSASGEISLEDDSPQRGH